MLALTVSHNLMNFTEYLISHIKPGWKIDDLENLFLSLFCTVDILPKEVQSFELTSELLSDSFSEFCVFNKVSKTKYQNRDTWKLLIDEMLNEGELPDLLKAKSLLNIK